MLKTLIINKYYLDIYKKFEGVEIKEINYDIRFRKNATAISISR